MSPASQGGLQVERYIGTCLISKVDLRYPHGAWAGVPIISMVQPRRNLRNNNNNNSSSNKQQVAGPPCPQVEGPPPVGPPGRSPLSRLAIHTQGAPLILAGRYNHNNNNNNNNRKNGCHTPPGAKAGGPNPLGPVSRSYRGGDLVRVGHVPIGGPGAARQQQQQQQQQQQLGCSDNVSVASDESSGHSENSLPRIIKPRKRRKKDRKPPPLQAPAAVPTVSLKSIGGDPQPQPQPRPQDEAPADEPKLHHDFDEVQEHEHEDDGPMVCQCRYCDPAGLIWDVDQNCYSPFLTPPLGTPLGTPPRTPSITPAATPASSPSPSFFTEMTRTSSALFPGDLRASSDLLLRRSWSEPSSSRKSSESGDSQEAGRRSPFSHQALQVSSEIVTSHNGHRDIEIKFFSTPARSSSPASSSEAVEATDCKQSSVQCA